MQGQLWTPEADARLTALWASGVTATAIGAEFGLSKSSILGRRRRLRLTARREGVSVASAWTDAQNAVIRRLWGQGVPAREIAAALGRTKGAILHQTHKLGLPRRQSGPQTVRKFAQPRPRPVFDLNAVYPDPVTDRPCQYITGEPTADDSCKCGRPAKIGSSYCPAHFYLCNAGMTWAPAPGRNQIDNGPLCQPRPAAMCAGG